MNVIAWFQSRFRKPQLSAHATSAEITAYLKRRAQKTFKPALSMNVSYCAECRRLVFDDQREICVFADHTTEPRIQKFFTEKQEYFEGVEMEADRTGKLLW